MDIFALNSVTFEELCIRLSLAAAAGFILGLDRDLKNKPVDFRAYMIVCVASALLAVMAMEIPYSLTEHRGIVQIDPNRIVQGILTGIGFLGAGAIIKKNDDSGVIGTATGASIWASGSIGLAIGFGYYALALAAFLIIAIALVALGQLMRVTGRLVDNHTTIGE